MMRRRRNLQTNDTGGWVLNWAFANGNTPLDEGMTAFRTVYGSYGMTDAGFELPRSAEVYHGSGLAYPFGQSGEAVWEFDVLCSDRANVVPSGLALCLHSGNKHAQITFPYTGTYRAIVSKGENIKIGEEITDGDHTIRVEFRANSFWLYIDGVMIHKGDLEEGVSTIRPPGLNLSGNGCASIINNKTKWIISSHLGTVAFTGIRYKEA